MCEVENTARSYYSHIPFDLFTATSIGDSEYVRQILTLPRIRNQLNVSNKGGWTPTMYSAYYGHDNILLLLIQNGADVNFINSENQTALMLAVKCGNLKCCEILLKSGAFVDAVDSYIFTALAYAVSAGYDDVALFLIKHNADVNMKLGENQMTPIMFAAAAGHEKVVKILMEAGAVPHTKSVIGFTARSLALDKGNFKIVNLLDGCQPSVFNYDPFPKVCPKKYLDIVLPVRTNSPISPSQLEQPFPNDLPALLNSLGLSEYTHFFEKQNINLEAFLQLTNENLKELGIDKFGPRIKMSKSISRLSSGILQPNSPIQKVTANRQQLEIESLKQKLAKCESQLLQERIISRSADASDSFSTQIQNTFLPLSNLEWQSETLRGVVKSLRDQILSERSKLDNDFASQLVDKVLNIDRITTEIRVQVSDVLKSLNDMSKNAL